MSYADKRDHKKAFDSDEAGVEWNPSREFKPGIFSQLTYLTYPKMLFARTKSPPCSKMTKDKAYLLLWTGAGLP